MTRFIIAIGVMELLRLIFVGLGLAYFIRTALGDFIYWAAGYDILAAESLLKLLILLPRDEVVSKSAGAVSGSTLSTSRSSKDTAGGSKAKMSVATQMIRDRGKAASKIAEKDVTDEPQELKTQTEEKIAAEEEKKKLSAVANEEGAEVTKDEVQSRVSDEQSSSSKDSTGDGEDDVEGGDEERESNTSDASDPGYELVKD